MNLSRKCAQFSGPIGYELKEIAAILIFISASFCPFLLNAQALTKEVFKTHSDGSPEVVYHYQGEQREANKVRVEKFGYNGDKILEENYRNQKLHGKRSEWYVYSKGKTRLIKENNYWEGQLDGLQQEWFSEGEIKNEYNYKKGKLDGPQVARFEKDKVRFELNYVQGKPEGVQKEWTDEMAKKYELKFVNGKLDGFQRWWAYDGKVFEEDWKNGILTLETTKKEKSVLEKYTFALDSTSISLDPYYKNIDEYRKLHKRIFYT